MSENENRDMSMLTMPVVAEVKGQVVGPGKSNMSKFVDEAQFWVEELVALGLIDSVDTNSLEWRTRATDAFQAAVDAEVERAKEAAVLIHKMEMQRLDRKRSTFYEENFGDSSRSSSVARAAAL